jgi:multisubunit Na+/H+ antiporter MnhG subunit
MVLQIFPLLTISLVIYTVLSVTGMGGDNGAAWHDIVVVSLPMYSGDIWRVTWGALFLTGSMGLLFVELIRATKAGTASITNHLLSFLLFVVALLLFILAKGFGNSTYFIFLTMTFLDPMAGLVVTTVSARRDLAVTDIQKGH